MKTPISDEELAQVRTDRRRTGKLYRAHPMWTRRERDKFTVIGVLLRNPGLGGYDIMRTTRKSLGRTLGLLWELECDGAIKGIWVPGFSATHPRRRVYQLIDIGIDPFRTLP